MNAVPQTPEAKFEVSLLELVTQPLCCFSNACVGYSALRLSCQFLLRLMLCFENQAYSVQSIAVGKYCKSFLTSTYISQQANNRS